MNCCLQNPRINVFVKTESIELNKLLSTSLIMLRETTDLSVADEGQWRKKCYVDSSCGPQVHKELSDF